MSSWWQTTPVASQQISKWMDRSLRQSQASNTWAQLYNCWGFQAWDTLQDSTDNCSFDKAEISLDWQEHFFQLQDMTDVLPCHIHHPVCFWIMDPHSRAPQKNTSHGNEVLPQDTAHLIRRPSYQWRNQCQDPAGSWATQRPDDRKETQTAVVWSCLPFIRSGRNHLARHSERGKKTRQTEEEVGRQHQGMDRPGVRQVPEGSGEQGKMEKTGCKIISGAQTTLTVKELMMMIMFSILVNSSQFFTSQMWSCPQSQQFPRVQATTHNGKITKIQRILRNVVTFSHLLNMCPWIL